MWKLKVEDSLSLKMQLLQLAKAKINNEDSLSLRNSLRHPPNVDQGAK